MCLDSHGESDDEMSAPLVRRRSLQFLNKIMLAPFDSSDSNIIMLSWDSDFKSEIWTRMHKNKARIENTNDQHGLAHTVIHLWKSCSTRHHGV